MPIYKSSVNQIDNPDFYFEYVKKRDNNVKKIDNPIQE